MRSKIQTDKPEVDKKISIDSQIDKYWLEELLRGGTKPEEIDNYFTVKISETSGQVIVQGNNPARQDQDIIVKNPLIWWR